MYVHYSGHGQQMTDVHNDEKDGLDECWIPYDACRKASATYHGEKHLTDDELNVYLNAIRNANRVRKKALDNLSNEEDYFNEGYNSCLAGISSPFFNLYFFIISIFSFHSRTRLCFMKSRILRFIFLIFCARSRRAEAA